jgi:hypothetical protein
MRTRRRFGRLPLMSVLIALTMVTVGAIGPMAAATPTSATVASAKLDPASSLVGTWQRVLRCKELVRALEKAGLEEFVLDAVVGSGFLPGVTSPDQIADPKHPCKGAVPQLHSHFFTADGQFGSLDADGNQVDEGTYTIVDDTLVMPHGFALCHCRAGGRPAAARRAGLEVVEKLLTTNLTSTDTTERNAGMLRVPLVASLVELATGSGSSSSWSSPPSPTAGSVPVRLATTSTADRAVPASAVQARCWSRPRTARLAPLTGSWVLG